MLIREATDADLPSIAPFFRETVSDGETYAFPEDLDDDGVHAWWFERPPGQTVVAVDDGGTVLGSAKMGPNRPGRGSHIGTASFMVAPQARGRGVGRALGEYAVACALHHATAVSDNRWIDKIASQRTDAGQRAILVARRQTAEADDVHHQDCCQLARVGHFLPRRLR